MGRSGRRNGSPSSTQEPASAGEDSFATVGDTIVDPAAEEAYQQVLDDIEVESVRDLTVQLDERERTIVQAHYGLGGSHRR